MPWIWISLRDNIWILFAMLFLHIIDDFKLQIGFLSQYKQKHEWEILDISDEKKKLYRYDYLVCLFIHSFSWAFSVMLIPTIVYFDVLKCDPMWYLFFLINMFIHAFVDHCKANIQIISLVYDQSIHILQIIGAWVLCLRIVHFNG